MKTLTSFYICCIALLFCLQGQAQTPEPPLEYWLADNAPFWSWTPQNFAQEATDLGFRWMDEGKTSVRAAPLAKPFFDHPVYECVIRFEEGSPENVMISYYNRGDAQQPLSEADFQALVRGLMSKITATLRVQPRPGNHQSSRNTVRDDSRIWQRNKIQFELSYSFSPPSGGNPFLAEYIRLTAKKFKAGDMPTHANTSVNPYEIKNNITRDLQTGDVWIANIPMVDQGPKGYCAAATSERILRFFGQEVDQHQIAQIANTTSHGGTSSSDLQKALHAVSRQYDFKMSTHIEWEFDDFQKMIERYNRAANKKNQGGIYLDRSRVIMIGDVYNSLDPALFKQVRMSRKSDYKKFQDKVKNYIDGGCPLSWSVHLGLFEESTPTGAGGHLRMIIGYNSQTNEIIYSDSWGRGHEKKSMPMDQAFTITQSLFSLEPKGLRL